MNNRNYLPWTLRKRENATILTTLTHFLAPLSLVTTEQFPYLLEKAPQAVV